MNIRIENIRERFNNNSYWVVIEDSNLSRPFKILIGTTYKKFMSGINPSTIDCVRTPHIKIYESDIVITVDVLCRNFSIIKNRYGSSGFDRDMDSDHFLNLHLPSVIENLLSVSEYFIYSQFDVDNIIAAIVSVISQLTGEPIFHTTKWVTWRDMYMKKEHIIKYKPLKHSFTNAGVS